MELRGASDPRQPRRVIGVELPDDANGIVVFGDGEPGVVPDDLIVRDLGGLLHLRVDLVAEPGISGGVLELAARHGEDEQPGPGARLGVVLVAIRVVKVGLGDPGLDTRVFYRQRLPQLTIEAVSVLLHLLPGDRVVLAVDRQDVVGPVARRVAVPVIDALEEVRREARRVTGASRAHVPINVVDCGLVRPQDLHDRFGVEGREIRLRVEHWGSFGSDPLVSPSHRWLGSRRAKQAGEGA